MGASLEDIKIGTIVEGLSSSGSVEVVAVDFHGIASTVVYRDQASGQGSVRLFKV